MAEPKKEKTPEEKRIPYFKYWMNADAQHGLTHNPRILHSCSQSLAPCCLPTSLPAIPEVCSGDLDDPATPGEMTFYGSGGAATGGMHSLLHHPDPMASNPEEPSGKTKQKTKHKTPYMGKVADGVFPPLTSKLGSLYERFVAKDPETLAMIPPEVGEPDEVVAQIIEAHQGNPAPAADSLLKQVYFRVGEEFHLLGVVPSSLLQVHLCDVRRALRAQDKVLKDTLTITIGGAVLDDAKPQNVGTLAIVFRCLRLLPSRPPHRKSSHIPWNRRSLFHKWAHFTSVRRLFRELDEFLAGNPKNNRHTRRRRDAFMGQLIENLLLYRESLRTEPGWTSRPGCRLPEAQKVWLDPKAESPLSIKDVWDQIAQQFSQSVEANLPSIPHGAPERALWRDMLKDMLRDNV